MIHGYAGSTAEAYTAKYGRKFELISGEPPIKPVENDILYGDANCDGKINLADVVLIMQSLSNPDKYGLNGNAPTHITRQGMLNGDISGNDGITNLDALTIQKFMLELITKLPE